MLQSLFNSLSGMFSFARGLDNVSNNISNMNTPGFRGTDSFFESVGQGRGSRVAGDGLRTGAGDIRQTGNSTDLAIDGSGFFVLRDAEGRLHYTRAGQFRFNEEGVLIDSVTRFDVMAIQPDGSLQQISVQGANILPPEATTSVNFTGNLSPSATTVPVSNIRIFTATGEARVLTATFTNTSATTPDSWSVAFTDSTGAAVGSGTIRFTAGLPAAGANSVAVTLPGTTQSVTFNFGTPGTTTGMTQISGLSNALTARASNGREALARTGVSIDDEGRIQYQYGAERREGPRIALAYIQNEGDLEMESGRLVSGIRASDVQYGRAGEGQFGSISGGSLELANVDLTQEFADMIVIQRGYQASSRVMTVTNEMLQNLFDATRGR
jgi:flagellar hook protein FlgE